MSKERNYLFSNIKAFLIFTVVFGHFLELNESTRVIDYIKLFIYFFHMPAFIFISGYFSKDLEKANKKAFTSYLIPFLFMTMVYCVFYKPLTGGSLVFRLVNPVFATWYLQVLFIYKISMKYLAKIKYILPVSVVVALVTGMITGIGKNFSLARVFAFFPIFLLGYYCKEEHIRKLRMLSKKAAAGMMGIFAIGLLVFNYYFKLSYKLLLNAESYYAVGVDNLSGMVVRAITLSTAVFFIAMFIVLFPDKKVWYSYIGDNTMAVYALHGLFYVYCKHHGVFDDFTSVTGALVAFGASIPVVFLLSWPVINRIYGKGLQIVCDGEKRFLYGRKKHTEFV